MYNSLIKNLRSLFSIVISGHNARAVMTALLISWGFFLGDAEAQVQRFPKYSLSGVVALQYDRQWSSGIENGNDSADRFIHSYSLLLESHIIDPRLITYSIDGMFTQELHNNYSDISTYRIGTTFTFFNAPIMRGGLRYLPRPITIRFSYQNDSEGNDATSYGISMAWSRPEKFRLFYKGRLLDVYEDRSAGNNNVNGSRNNSNSNTNSNGPNNGQSRLAGIPLPQVNFDYDVSKYHVAGRSIETSNLNLRAGIVTQRYEYLFQYLRDTWDYDGASDATNLVTLDANYFLFDSKSRKRFDIYNRLEYFSREKADDPTLLFRNTTVWSTPTSNNNFDQFTVRGGAHILHAEDTTYGGEISPTYTKRFSPRITGTAGAAASYQKDISDNRHMETVFGNIYFDVNRFLSASSSVTLGFNSDGTQFGASVSASTKTRISLSAGYDFLMADVPDGRSTRHNFGLTAAGPLFNRGTFSVSAKYVMLDYPEGNWIKDEDALELMANANFQHEKNIFQLQGRYLKVKRSGRNIIDETKGAVISLTYYRPISKRVLFNMVALWSKTDPGTTQVEFKPRVTFVYRQLSANMEYDLIRTTEPYERTDHRFLVNVTRNFGMKF